VITGTSLIKCGGCVGALAIILFWGAHYLGTESQGRKPTRSMSDFYEQERAEVLAALEPYRAKVKQNPNSVADWRALARILGDKIESDPQQANTLGAELLAVIEKIVELEPSDEQGLLTLGNIYYSHQAFERAAGYFKRYLELRPTDMKLRTTYASALTFLNRLPEAKAELETVLAKEPENFLAHANMAATLSALGDKAGARKHADLAVASAKTPEAKTRVEQFVQNLDEPKPTTENPRDTNAKPEFSAPFEHPLVKLLVTHPIVGPRLADVKLIEGGTLQVFLKDFPMSAMPPVAKEKFYARIRTTNSEALQARVEPALSQIIFIDAPTATTMEVLSLATE
jgi:tetratricopeptide (TPR) repeat protein